MKIFFLFLFHFICFNTIGQNLVHNGSFENSDLIINSSYNKFNNEHISGVEIAPGWFTVTPATPDYFSSSFSNDTINNSIVLPLNGEGRIGFIGGSCRILFGSTQYKEYVQGSLNEPLVVDRNYEISFYIAHDPRSTVAIDDFGLIFSDTIIRSEEQRKLSQKPDILFYPEKPIISEYGWVKMSAIYKARGGEKYIIIGSFSEKSCIPLTHPENPVSRNNTDQRIIYNAYYFLDEVNVKLSDETNEKTINALPGMEAKSDKYLLVIDISQSMGEKNKLEYLKTSVKEIIDELPAESEIAIVGYHSKSKLMLPFTIAKNKQLIIASMDSLIAGGNTDFTNCIKFSYDYLKQERKKGQRELMIVFTDGIFNVDLITQKLIKNSNSDFGTGFSVVQFGETINGDLQRLTISAKCEYIIDASKNLSQKLDSVFYEKNNKSTIFYPIYLSGEEKLVKFQEEKSSNDSNKKEGKRNRKFLLGTASVLFVGILTAVYFIFK